MPRTSAAALPVRAAPKDPPRPRGSLRPPLQGLYRCHTSRPTSQQPLFKLLPRSCGRVLFLYGCLCSNLFKGESVVQPSAFASHTQRRGTRSQRRMGNSAVVHGHASRLFKKTGHLTGQEDEINVDGSSVKSNSSEFFGNGVCQTPDHSPAVSLLCVCQRSQLNLADPGRVWQRPANFCPVRTQMAHLPSADDTHRGSTSIPTKREAPAYLPVYVRAYIFMYGFESFNLIGQPALLQNAPCPEIPAGLSTRNEKMFFWLVSFCTAQGS